MAPAKGLNMTLPSARNKLQKPIATTVKLACQSRHHSTTIEGTLEVISRDLNSSNELSNVNGDPKKHLGSMRHPQFTSIGLVTGKRHPVHPTTQPCKGSPTLE